MLGFGPLPGEGSVCSPSVGSLVSSAWYRTRQSGIVLHRQGSDRSEVRTRSSSDDRIHVQGVVNLGHQFRRTLSVTRTQFPLYLNLEGWGGADVIGPVHPPFLVRDEGLQGLLDQSKTHTHTHQWVCSDTIVDHLDKDRDRSSRVKDIERRLNGRGDTDGRVDGETQERRDREETKDIVYEVSNGKSHLVYCLPHVRKSVETTGIGPVPSRNFTSGPVLLSP